MRRPTRRARASRSRPCRACGRATASADGRRAVGGDAARAPQRYGVDARARVRRRRARRRRAAPRVRRRARGRRLVGLGPAAEFGFGEWCRAAAPGDGRVRVAWPERDAAEFFAAPRGAPPPARGGSVRSAAVALVRKYAELVRLALSRRARSTARATAEPRRLAAWTPHLMLYVQHEPPPIVPPRRRAAARAAAAAPSAVTSRAPRGAPARPWARRRPSRRARRDPLVRARRVRAAARRGRGARRDAAVRPRVARACERPMRVGVHGLGRRGRTRAACTMRPRDRGGISPRVDGRGAAHAPKLLRSRRARRARARARAAAPARTAPRRARARSCAREGCARSQRPRRRRNGRKERVDVRRAEHAGGPSPAAPPRARPTLSKAPPQPPRARLVALARALDLRPVPTAPRTAATDDLGRALVHERARAASARAEVEARRRGPLEMRLAALRGERKRRVPRRRRRGRDPSRL